MISATHKHSNTNWGFAQCEGVDWLVCLEPWGRGYQYPNLYPNIQDNLDLSFRWYHPRTFLSGLVLDLNLNPAFVDRMPAYRTVSRSVSASSGVEGLSFVCMLRWILKACYLFTEISPLLFLQPSQPSLDHVTMGIRKDKVFLKYSSRFNLEILAGCYSKLIRHLPKVIIFRKVNQMQSCVVKNMKTRFYLVKSSKSREISRSS